LTHINTLLLVTILQIQAQWRQRHKLLKYLIFYFTIL